MKYRCSHCHHAFELEERAFQRCPNCFWTTSLVPEDGENKELSPASKVFSQTVKKSGGFRLPKGLVVSLLVIGLAGVLFFVYLKFGKPISKFSVSLPTRNFMRQKNQKPKDQEVSSKSVSLQQVKSVLTQTEQAELTRSLQVTIPRQLSEDEEQILKKQVSSPAQLVKKPKLTAWKKKDFETMLDTEEKKRKIYMGWSYDRSLVKTFEKSYPAAVENFEKGDYVLSRDLFLKSLSFLVYRNDPKFHRAVALVILRPYINDVIGKVATLNQYLLTQSLLTDVQGLFQSYEGMFAVLELHEWERALQIITELKKQIGALQSRPQDAEVAYPPSFNVLDAELQAAIRSEASPKPEGAVDLKALTIDLDLKEKVVRQNTSEELLKVQRQCEEISRLIAEGNLEQARDRLMGVEYPAELAAEARKKVTLIEKIFAVEQSKGK